MNKSRDFSDLTDKRLIGRGNKIFHDLFSKSVHSIRQFSRTSSEAKAAYRFFQNDRVSEADIIKNLQQNCVAAARNKYVVCIQDTTEVNLSSHGKRIKHDGYIGTTNSTSDTGLGFFVHPSLVLDAQTGVPYCYSAIKIWNRPLEFRNKHERNYNALPIGGQGILQVD